MSSFQQFLESKRHSSQSFGIEPLWLPDKMFDYQKYVSELTIKKGRWADFLDTGLGKTLIELVVAYNYVLSIGFVFVEYQWQIRFVDIENEDIEKEHDPNCRNIDALYETMLKFYPDFDAREIVTLVAFRFKPFSDAFTFSNLS